MFCTKIVLVRDIFTINRCGLTKEGFRTYIRKGGFLEVIKIIDTCNFLKIILH
ncbi:unnamed protein product [Moneuplotes crassus]|uniref:Uncharacterized protein n=1 Tax=Euplotes crassus TaxID=5936 RepID=A0AAD2DCG1_EUPCR|nr:unnamed protein product [Moneuplotes crassus]